MEAINPDSENILILALTGSVLSGAWLAYKLKLFKFVSTINDEKKILLPSFLFLLSPFLLPFIFSHNMLSDSSAISFFLSGTLGSVITGIFLIINTQRVSSINNKLQLEREEEQHIWQLEREKQQRIWQEKSEQQKWYREKIYDSYRKSFQVLTKIQQEELDSVNKNNDSLKKSQHLSNINKFILEFNIEFTMIIANHPHKNSEEFMETLSTIDESLRKDTWMVRAIIVKIMEDDSRIKNINE